MNIKQRPVYNAANFATFMVNLSHHLLRWRRTQIPDFSVNDLKAEFRGRFYAAQTLKLIPDLTDQVSIDALLDSLSSVGAIHR